MFLFIGVISKHELSMDVLIQGQISGLLFVAGTITQIVALTTGPGGPIQALINTCIIYQVVADAVFFGQELSLFQYLGIIFAILAGLLITIGD